MSVTRSDADTGWDCEDVTIAYNVTCAARPAPMAVSADAGANNRTVQLPPLELVVDQVCARQMMTALRVWFQARSALCSTGSLTFEAQLWMCDVAMYRLLVC